MEPEADRLVGAELLGYRVDAVLGRGGMGIVLRAWDATLERHVAIKLVVPDRSDDATFRARFGAESQLAASLEHPNVVPVYEAGEVEGRLAIVMRYVRGTDLRRLLEQERVLASARAVAICGQVASALDAAHEQGLVHRDVKPSNVLLDERGHAYLADFGVTGSLAGDPVGALRPLGTPAYAAPEQIRGAGTDGRADVYSLACVLFECVTGEPPFRRAGSLAALWAHLEEPPPRASERRPELPEALDAVLARGLAKRPEERHPSCGALVDDARRALGLREGRSRGRAPLLAAAAALLALALAGALVARDGGGSGPAGARIGDDTVVRVDPETNEVVAAVEVGAGLKAVAAGGRTVWVYNVTEGTVSAVDTGTNDVVRVSRVSTSPVEAAYYNGPLIAADGGGAWVVGTRDGEAILTRLLRGERPVEHPLVAREPVGDPVGVALGHGAVWVLTRGADIFAYDGPGDEVLRVSARTGALLARADPQQEAAASGAGTFYGLALGAGAVWITNAETARLSRLAPSSPGSQRHLGLDGSPLGVPAVGYGAVWVSEGGGTTLVRVDPRTLRRARVRTGGQVVDVAFLAGDVWANDVRGGAVVRIDPRTAALEARISLAEGSPRAQPLGSTLSPSIAAGAGALWVTVGPPAR